MHRWRIFPEMTLLLLIVLFGNVVSAVVPDFSPLTNVPLHDLWPVPRAYVGGMIQRNTMHDQYAEYLEQGRYIAFMQAVSVPKKPIIKEPDLIPDYMDIHAAGGIALEPSYPESTMRLISALNAIPESNKGERELKRRVIRAYLQYHSLVYKGLNRLALTVFYPNSTATSADRRGQIWAEELVRQLNSKDMPEWAAIKYLKLLTTTSPSVERDRTGNLSPSISFIYTMDFKEKLIEQLVSKHLHRELLEYLRTFAGDEKARRYKLSTKNLLPGRPLEEQTFFLKLNNYPANAFDAIMSILGNIAVSGDDKTKLMEHFKSLLCVSLKPDRQQNLARFFMMLALMPNPTAGSKQASSWEIRSMFINLCEPYRNVSWIEKVNDIVFKRPPTLGMKTLKKLLGQGIGSHMVDISLPPGRNVPSRSAINSRHELHIPLARPNLDIAWLLNDDLPDSTQPEEIDGFQYLSSHGPIERSRRLFDIQIGRPRRSTAGRKSLSIDSLASPDLSWLLHKDLQSPVQQYEIGGFHQLGIHGPRGSDRRLFDIQIERTRHSTASRKSLTPNPMVRPDLSWLLPIAGQTIYRRENQKPLLAFLRDRSHFDFDDIVLLGEMVQSKELLLQTTTVMGRNSLVRGLETMGNTLFSERRPETYQLLTNYADDVHRLFVKEYAIANAEQKKKATLFEANVRNNIDALASFYERKGLVNSPGFIDTVVDIAKKNSDSFPTKKMKPDDPLAYPVARQILYGLCFGPVKSSTNPTRCQRFAEHFTYRYREKMLILMDDLVDKPDNVGIKKQINQLNEEYFKLMGDLHKVLEKEFSFKMAGSFAKEGWQAILYGDLDTTIQTIPFDYVKTISTTLNLPIMAPFRLALYPWASHALLEAKDNGEFADSELLRGLAHNNLILDMKFFFAKKPNPALFYTDGFKYFFTKAVHTLATSSGFPIPETVLLKRWSPQPMGSFPMCDQPPPEVQATTVTTGTTDKSPEQQFAEARHEHQKQLNDNVDPNILETSSEYTCMERLLVIYFDQVQFPFHRVDVPSNFKWPDSVENPSRPDTPLDTFHQEWLLDVYDQLRDSRLDEVQALKLLSAYIRTLTKFMGFSPTLSHNLLVYMYSPLHDAVLQKGQELPSTETIIKAKKKAAASTESAADASGKGDLLEQIRKKGQKG